MQRPFPAYNGSEPYVFVSYSHTDSEQAFALLADLNNAGFNLWYDEGIEPGSSWRAELALAIKHSQQMLFVVSPASAASGYCQREVEYALSEGVEVQVCYIESAELPPSLAFELGGKQAVIAAQHDWSDFVEKVGLLLQGQGQRQGQRLPKSAAVNQRRFPRWSLGALLAIVIAAVASILVGPWWRTETVSVPPVAVNIRPTAENPATVAIRPIRNATGDAELDWLSGGLVNLLQDNLSASRYAVVLSQPSWNNIAADLTDETALFAAAREQGVDYLVSGYLMNDQDQLLLNVRVTNLRAGVDVLSQSFSGLTPKSLVNSAERVAIVAKQGMKIPRETRLESLSADFQVDNLAAYEAYIAGLRSYNDFDYEEAVEAFQTALVIEPTFHPALLRLANVQASRGQIDTALATLALIPEDAPLSTRERAYIEGTQAWLDGDAKRGVQLYEALLEKLPYDVDGQLSLAQALYQDYRESDAIVVLQALGKQEPQNHHVWSSISFMAMAINDLDLARDALQRYVVLAPDKANPWELLGSLELKSNNLIVATAHYKKALNRDPEYELAKLGLARTQALSGNYSIAGGALVALRADMAVSPRTRIGAAFDLAAMARAQGHTDVVGAQFDDVMTELQDERSRLAWSWAQRAYAAMDANRVDAASEAVTSALRYAQQSDVVPTRFLFLQARFELFSGQASAFETTLAKILEHQLPVDNTDRTEERAVAFLRGIAALAAQDNTAALQYMVDANALVGYQYELYGLGLARAQSVNNALGDAIANCDEAASERINYLAQDPRLDLEVYRRQARQLQAKLLERQGNKVEAQRLRQQISHRWGVGT